MVWNFENRKYGKNWGKFTLQIVSRDKFCGLCAARIWRDVRRLPGLGYLRAHAQRPCYLHLF